MKRFSGRSVGKYIEPKLRSAINSVYVCSPWISPEYAETLVRMAHKGIEIKIITSDDDLNQKTLSVLFGFSNEKLKTLIVPKEEAGLVHSKCYIVDHRYAFVGSANFTWKGFNENYEQIDMYEGEDEVAPIELNFLRLWIELDKYKTNEKYPSPKSVYIRNSLPVNVDVTEILNKGLLGSSSPKKLEIILEFLPYYFFEYSLRGGSTYYSRVFEAHGTVTVCAQTREVKHDPDPVPSHFEKYRTSDFKIINTGKFSVKLNPLGPVQQDEAKQVALDFIKKKNTQEYKVSRYSRTYIPSDRDIRFLRHYPAYLPVWSIDYQKDKNQFKTVAFASSGEVWVEMMMCPDCQKMKNINQTSICSVCHTRFCNNCIKKKGIFDWSPICKRCKQKM